ncbi:M81 family metallopeptidase [Candidatus Bathyarchaeota archaeon]|nr:M81 family metallopeptidase [Candidatus Bathyarchaeota archaeon]
MKLGIAGFSHETVSFWPGVTDLKAFERTALYGEDVIKKSRGTNTALGGFLDICEPAGVELHPVLAARGGATATVADEVYDHYVPLMRRGFEEVAGELDGILLALHGAMATESRQDPETDAVREVREAVGYEMPLMVTFDLHGNKDEAILKEATGIFGYHSSPHVDSGETGRRAARGMLATLAGEINPTMAIRKPGIVVPSVFSATTVSPGKDIIDRVLEWEAKEGVVDVTALMGFSWSDVHQLGMSMIAVTDDDPGLAQEIVDDLAELAWEKREYLTGRAKSSLYNVEDGVALAMEKAKTAEKPIVLLDCADRTNDTTYVLAELMAQGARNVAHPVFYSPEGAAVAVEAGGGRIVKVEGGGDTGWRDGGPIEGEGEGLYAGGGKYGGTGPMRGKQGGEHGPTGHLDVDGIWLQLVTHKTSLIDEDPIIQFGYKTQDFDIIVTKSKTHFRAVYEEVGEEIIIVDAPGQCPADPSVFDYKNIPGDLYPITKQ